MYDNFVDSAVSVEVLGGLWAQGFVLHEKSVCLDGIVLFLLARRAISCIIRTREDSLCWPKLRLVPLLCGFTMRSNRAK